MVVKARYLKVGQTYKNKGETYTAKSVTPLRNEIAVVGTADDNERSSIHYFNGGDELEVLSV